MDLTALYETMAYLRAHPFGAGVAVFLVAAAASLVVVGMFVYGGVVLFAAGAMAGAGALDLPPILAWAYAGTMLGDATSFWLGRRWGPLLRGRWPFCRHPQWLTRGEWLYSRFGAGSLLWGRLLGPVVPITRECSESHRVASSRRTCPRRRYGCWRSCSRAAHPAPRSYQIQDDAKAGSGRDLARNAVGFPAAARGAALRARRRHAD